MFELGKGRAKLYNFVVRGDCPGMVKGLSISRRFTGPTGMPVRERLILSGLYLSKFDSLGLQRLGFSGFVEAFNVIGYALGSKPASVKNYRDEFDPLFSNGRKGWHKRNMRGYCKAVYDEFNGLDFESFTSLVASFCGYDGSEIKIQKTEGSPDDGTSSFAQRLITGLAAENYFESVHRNVPEFDGYMLENTTRFGCGYDFRLRKSVGDKDFLAVEVKGLKSETGSLSMTPKEYDIAAAMKDRFFLFVVRNFRESPKYQIFQNPLLGGLNFRRVERVSIQISWQTNV